MKKLALIIAVAGIVGLSSCSKKGTECTITTLGIKTTVTVTDDEYKTCTAGVCATTSLGSASKDDYVSTLEAAGYSCK